MIRFFAHHKTAANLLTILVYAIGIISVFFMIRETFPEFSTDKVIVRVIYKGSSPAEVETSICTIIEEALMGVEGVDRMISKSSEGVGTVTLEMKDGKNIQSFYQDIKNEIDQISTFPLQAERPIVYIEKRQDPAISLALSGDVDFRNLKEYGESLRKRLLQNKFISLVELQGISRLQIRIKIDSNTLKSMGISVSRLKEIVLSQSKDLPVGSIETRDQEILLRVMDQKYSPEEFGNMVVLPSLKGSQIRLRDLAKISWDQERPEDSIFLNGKKAVVLSIKKSSGEDSLVIRREVQKFADSLKNELPQGIEARLIEDVAYIVQDRLTLLSTNAIQGLVLVFFTLWFFLDIRLAFWVAMGIPFSFLGALWIMQLYGLSINMITMVSLLLGLGLVVDDAIVIGENIYSHHKKGKDPVQASIDGTNQVFLGVVSSFLTTVAAFLPLIFMKGNMGKVLNLLPVGVILVLAASTVEAFLVLPNHLGHSMKREQKPYWLRDKLEKSIDYFIHHFFAPTVTFCLKNRYLTLTSMSTIFIIAVGLLAGGRVGFLPFPQLDGNVVECYVLLPSGTPLSQTKEVSQKISASLGEINQEWTPFQPQKKPLIENIKIRYGFNKEADEMGTHVATITAELLSSEERVNTCEEIIQKWRKKVGNPIDVLSLKFAQPAIGPAGKAFEIELKGQDYGQLYSASQEIQKKLATYEGVYNISDNLNPGKWEAHVTTLPQARNLGLTSRDITNQLGDSFFGGRIQEFQLGTENIEVKVQLSDSGRDSINDLENFYLLDARGTQIPLTCAAKIETKRNYTNIYHIGGRRSVSISADIDVRRGNASRITSELKSKFFPSLLAKYNGIQVDFGGQARETGKTGPSAARGFFIGLLLIFIILSFAFSSYVQPFTIMMAIPFGFAGAIFGHYFMGLDLSMPSIVGVVALSGIVVNDAIVLIEFMNDHQEEGKSAREAIYLACLDRFRAVFLTSATTIAGLLPLLMAKSLQAQVLIPLATSVAFGLLFSTVIVLVFVPALTVIFLDWGWIRDKSKGTVQTNHNNS